VKAARCGRGRAIRVTPPPPNGGSAASTAAVPNVVAPGEVTWANRTISIGRNAGALPDPVLGGAGYGLISACWGGGAIVGSFLGPTDRPP
jgi:hypothetical protein